MVIQRPCVSALSSLQTVLPGLVPGDPTSSGLVLITTPILGVQGCCCAISG